ncbi:GPP34 family phosphoprotein [Nocardia sp. NPDC052254]|uniref:GPP34 family phosphoprotein n=1 Tax=Nocardia sp. NPDC052254 TaxID=3155681 RepID=UPI003423F679
MTPVSHNLLWLLLDDDTGRPLLDRATTGRALTVAAVADIACGAPRQHGRSLSSRQRRERSLATLHSTRCVRRDSIRMGGVVPRTVWPTVDLPGKQALRRALERALFDAQQPDRPTRALIAILHAADVLAVQFPRWPQHETGYWAGQFIVRHSDCAELAESLRRLDREALADALGFGARPLFVPRTPPGPQPVSPVGHRARAGRSTAE